MSSLDSGPSSAKLTPQKFSCKSTDSTPACISFEASWRTQIIRNFAFFCPRCKSTMVPGCNWARSAPRRAPDRVISSVCAKRDSFANENLTGSTIFLRAVLRFSTIRSLKLCCRPINAETLPSSQNSRELNIKSAYHASVASRGDQSGTVEIARKTAGLMPGLLVAAKLGVSWWASKAKPGYARVARFFHQLHRQDTSVVVNSLKYAV